MMYLIIAAGSATFGFVIAALFNTQAYDKGFDDGFSQGIWSAQRMREEEDDEKHNTHR